MFVLGTVHRCYGLVDHILCSYRGLFYMQLSICNVYTIFSGLLGAASLFAISGINWLSPCFQPKLSAPMAPSLPIQVIFLWRLNSSPDNVHIINFPQLITGEIDEVLFDMLSLDRNSSFLSTNSLSDAKCIAGCSFCPRWVLSLVDDPCLYPSNITDA